MRDASGKSGAIGALRGGKSPDDSGNFCTFAFTVKVPSAKFYSFEIADHGKVTFSAVQLKRAKWLFALE